MVTGKRVIKEVVATGFGNWSYVDGEQNDELLLDFGEKGNVGIAKKVTDTENTGETRDSRKDNIEGHVYIQLQIPSLWISFIFTFYSVDLYPLLYFATCLYWIYLFFLKQFWLNEFYRITLFVLGSQPIQWEG